MKIHPDLYISSFRFNHIRVIYGQINIITGGSNKLWKILKEMRIPENLTCLLRNLYAGQEATVRTGHGTTDWFQIGKGVRQGEYCHPAYLTYMQSTS